MTNAKSNPYTPPNAEADSTPARTVTVKPTGVRTISLLLGFIRKLAFVVLVCFAAPFAHFYWGHEYQGPGMNHIELLVVVIYAGMFLAFILSLIYLVSWLIMWRWKINRRWMIDCGLFVPFMGLSIFVGTTAKIVDSDSVSSVPSVQQDVAACAAFGVSRRAHT